MVDSYSDGTLINDLKRVLKDSGGGIILNISDHDLEKIHYEDVPAATAGNCLLGTAGLVHDLVEYPKSGVMAAGYVVRLRHHIFSPGYRHHRQHGPHAARTRCIPQGSQRSHQY